MEEACQWFETAADQYKISAIKRPDWSESSSELKNIPADLTKALQMAIISGNQSLVADIARATLAVDRAYPYEVEHTGEKVTVEIDADRYHHVRALASLALGDDTRAEEHLDALRAALDDIAEPGDRQARFAADVLSHHKADMQGAVPEIDTEAICVGATAFGCLARQRGLPVTLDSEFIPTALVDAVS